MPLCATVLPFIFSYVGNRVGSAKEVVQKGQQVWVKVVSVNASKVSLSMRDVDQQTGQDLLPAQTGRPGSSSNPAPAGHSLRGLSGITVKEDDSGGQPKRRLGKRMTSPERWEITQLIKSGVLDVRDYPTFDEEEGVSICSAACQHSQPCTQALGEQQQLFSLTDKCV